jgi:hypothetical protein
MAGAQSALVVRAGAGIQAAVAMAAPPARWLVIATTTCRERGRPFTPSSWPSRPRQGRPTRCSGGSGVRLTRLVRKLVGLGRATALRR